MLNTKIIKLLIHKKQRHLMIENDQWNQYKKTFQHPQMLFLISELANLFQSSLSLVELNTLEFSLTNKPKNFSMFKEAIRTIFQSSVIEGISKLNSNNLAYFLFYIYQISTFYYDQKNNVKNIYNYDNFVFLNIEKRKYFAAFAEDIRANVSNFNFYIKKILRLVL